MTLLLALYNQNNKSISAIPQFWGIASPSQKIAFLRDEIFATPPCFEYTG
jgi:hypothetical protein